MIDNVVSLQPAFILHYRNFRETSLIAEVLTRDFGRFAVVAKGVRTPKSKLGPYIRPFVPVLLSFAGKSDLKTLTHIEPWQSAPKLNDLALYSGFYINELVTYFLHSFDPHPEVFLLYQNTLSELSNTLELEPVLRVFELNLLTQIGYGLQFDVDTLQQPVSPNKKYYFNADLGPVESELGDFSGSTLLALEARSFPNTATLTEAKKIMRSAINFHLNGKPLKSREVISKILKHSHS